MSVQYFLRLPTNQNGTSHSGIRGNLDRNMGTPRPQSSGSVAACTSANSLIAGEDAMEKSTSKDSSLEMVLRNIALGTGWG
jgi:hypothetical protein